MDSESSAIWSCCGTIKSSGHSGLARMIAFQLGVNVGGWGFHATKNNGVADVSKAGSVKRKWVHGLRPINASVPSRRLWLGTLLACGRNLVRAVALKVSPTQSIAPSAWRRTTHSLPLASYDSQYDALHSAKSSKVELNTRFVIGKMWDVMP